MEEVQPTRQDIIKDLRNWSLHFLEVRNEHLGGMPACPFAKNTWKQKKVRIEIKPKKLWYKKTLNGILDDFDWEKHEILIFCDLSFLCYLIQQGLLIHQLVYYFF